MTNPSEQSIEVRQQILDTLWLTEELLETPAHISITSNDINRLVALVDKATRERAEYEVIQCRSWLAELIDPLEPKPSDEMIKNKLLLFDGRLEAIEELSNKDKPAYGFENHPYIALDERGE